MPVAAAAAVAVLPGCVGGDSSDRPPEPVDRPVPAPPGWRTVENADAGFTIAAPRRWTARIKRDATLIRSPDKLVAITIAADRNVDGRQRPPAEYARATFEALPRFEGSLRPGTTSIRASPYRNARIDGRGTIATTRRPQRVTIVAFQRPGVVTYVVVVFRNALVRPPPGEVVLGYMLKTLRARLSKLQP